MVSRSNEDTELVPLEGEDEGLGNFLGNIWSHNALGILAASTSSSGCTMKATRRERIRKFLLQESDMFPVSVLIKSWELGILSEQKELAEPCGRPFYFKERPSDRSKTRLSIMRRGDNCLFQERWFNGRQWNIWLLLNQKLIGLVGFSRPYFNGAIILVSTARG